MTLQEYLAQMAATQGRQNRGQTNLTTAQRAELEAIIRQQYGQVDPSRVGWEISNSDNPAIGLGSNPLQSISQLVPQYAALGIGAENVRGFDPSTGQYYAPNTETRDVMVSNDSMGSARFLAPGFTSNLGQFHDQDEGKYYRIIGNYDDAGALQGVDYRAFRPEGGWLNDNLELVAALTLAGMGGYAALTGGGAGGAGAGLAEGTIMGGTGAGAGGAGVLGNTLGGGMATSAGATLGAGAGSAAAGLAGAGLLPSLSGTVGSLLSNPAVIGGGLSLVGGALGADAASDAAEMQQQSANAAIEEVRRQYDQNRADQMPWLQAGQASLADLMSQMGSLTTPYTQADFQNDPGYQFELAEGQRALDAAARARGLYGSSGALRELLRYSQGLASTRYQDAWNRDLTNRQNTFNMLSGVSGTGQVTAGNLGAMGQSTANTVGDLLTQTGNAQAAGRVGSANAWTQAGSNALNAWQQQMLIDKIGSNLYR